MSLVLFFLHRLLHILVELLPGILMVHKIFGTDLSRHVIVADHVLGLQLNSVQKYAHSSTRDSYVLS